MNAHQLEILVVKGPLEGRRFQIPSGGMRLGRSSSCEIAIADPALSRNHLLFEAKDGALFVTDLASANGTQRNGVDLGAEAVQLAAGDVLLAGETELRVVEAGEETPPVAPAAVDLGLSAASAAPVARKPFGRILLWIAALVAVGGAAALILATPGGTDAGGLFAPATPEEKLLSVRFETVKADEKGIFRYALAFDADGTLGVESDDLPDGGRNLSKKKKLDAAAVAQLSAIFADPEFARLEPEYVVPAAGTCAYKRCRLVVVRSKRVQEVLVENAAEPEPLRDVRAKLETFSQHELGIVGIQLPREELLAKSEESVRAGDEKWDARDVEYGNVAAALKAYESAVYYLETVNPKPAGYDELLRRRDAAKVELDKRWRDRYFLVDKAIHGEEWETARRELTVLCALVPDARDPRHEEAHKKLLDVEARAKKKGGAR